MRFNEYKNQIVELGIKTSSDLENYKFAMLPGIDFGFKEDELFFRIAFVDLDFIKLNTLNIYSGVEKIKEFISQLKC
jgi:hypothetical protein